MSSFRSFTLAAAVLLAAMVPASAQNMNATPNYGTVNLRSGFTPDPNVVAVQSGGSIDARRIDSACAGFITAAPDVRLVYSAGSLPLIISVASRGDTTLVINGPDGKPTQLTFLDDGYIDYFGRPWAQNWEKHFEAGWDRPGEK